MHFLFLFLGVSPCQLVGPELGAGSVTPGRGSSSDIRAFSHEAQHLGRSPGAALGTPKLGRGLFHFSGGGRCYVLSLMAAPFRGGEGPRDALGAVCAALGRARHLSSLSVPVVQMRNPVLEPKDVPRALV